MQVKFEEKMKINTNDVEIGDILIFFNKKNEPSGVYIICFNSSMDKYYLQNINGIKGKSTYYDAIATMLVERKNYRIIKKDKALLSIHIGDCLDCDFSPFQ